MHWNYIWEMLISKSDLEPLLSEVLAFPAHGAGPSPKSCKESALLGQWILEFSFAEGTGHVSYFSDLIQKCKVLGEAVGPVMRFAIAVQ